MAWREPEESSTSDCVLVVTCVYLTLCRLIFFRSADPALPCQALNLKLFNSRSVPKPVYVRSIFKMLPFGNRLDVRSASMMMDMIGRKSNLVFKCDFSHCHFDQVIKLDQFVQYLKLVQLAKYNEISCESSLYVYLWSAFCMVHYFIQVAVCRCSDLRSVTVRMYTKKVVVYVCRR